MGFEEPTHPARSAKYVEPDQSDASSPALLAKIFLFPSDPNHLHIPAIPPHHEGRFAIVTDERRVAVDAEMPITNGSEADGEVVWS
jgi:hypothetical protein